MPLVAVVVKLRAIALSEISQMLNETLPYRVQRNFARLGRAQRLLLPDKLNFFRQAEPAEFRARANGRHINSDVGGGVGADGAGTTRRGR